MAELSRCGFEYLVSFGAIRFVRKAPIPLATWSWDWGVVAPLGRVGEWFGDYHSALAPDALPCVVIHPIDVDRGYLPRCLRVIDRLRRRGRDPVLFSELAAASPEGPARDPLAPRPVPPSIRRRRRRLARRLAPHLPAGARLLDIGSGTGHNARPLRLRTGGACLEADVVDFHVVGGGPMLFDGVRLPLPDDEVDVSLIIHALSYADDPATLLREAGRVASRGVLLIQIDVSRALGAALPAAPGLLPGPAVLPALPGTRLIPPVPDPLRPRRVFSRERLEAIVGASGLVLRCLEPEPDPDVVDESGSPRPRSFPARPPIRFSRPAE